MLEVRFLGTFAVAIDGKPVTLSSRAAQSLLAYLILTAGTSHRREKLAGTFWPDAAEEKARAYLRHELWRIRKLFPGREFLVSNDIEVALVCSKEFWFDVDVLVTSSGTPSAEELMTALSVYKGELLPGFYEEWVIPERERLQAVFEQNMMRLLALLEREKRWKEKLEWAERWISLAQGPEAAYRSLMSAYTALGDLAKVVSTYERCVRSLAELGLEPSEETRAFLKQRSSKINIPIPLTSFIGRENELREVAALLSRSRLVTLTGSGGVGKTRLAIQAVMDVLELFPDGVWFLDLAPVSDSGLVPNTLAKVLDLSMTGNSDLSYTDLIIGYLGSRRALIIFDNCEHLIESCAQLVHSLLTSCEYLSVLATSREALRVSGEFPYRVPSLRVPDLEIELLIQALEKTESVRLFLERAWVSSPKFTIGPHNALTIAQICKRLDGIPLAIELAATRVNVMGVEQILKRLDDRFHLLTGGLRTALPRHQTLRATIEWSYHLLSEKERLLFQRLAVFVGGWTLEAAETVCTGNGIEINEVLDLLTQLIDKSLVQAEAGSDGTRYHRLETIGQFAHEKLLLSIESNQLRNLHCAYFLDLGKRADRETYWPNKQKWKDRLDIENDNLRTALEWCVAQGITESALQLLGVWAENGRLPGRELEEWFARVLALPEVSTYPAFYARLLNHLGLINWLRRNEPYSRSILEKSQAIWLTLGEDGELGLAEAWATLGDLALGEDLPTAQLLFERSLALYQKHGNEWGIGMVMFSLGRKAMIEGRYAEAAELNMKVLSRWKMLDNRFGVLRILNQQGEVARLQGDYEQAGNFYEQCVKIARQLRDLDFLAAVMYNYAWVSLRTGNYPDVKLLLEECVELRTRDGYKSGIMDCLAIYAAILGMTGKAEEAARLFGASESLLQDAGISPLDPSDQKEVDHYKAVVRELLGEAAYAKALAEGSRMTLDDAVTFARDESSD